MIGELRLVSEHTIDGWDVCIGTFRTTQIGDGELVGILRIEYLSMSDDDRHILLSHEADTKLSNHVLPHIDDETTIACATNALCIQFLLHLHTLTGLRQQDARRFFQAVGLLPTAVVEGSCRPVCHLTGSLVAFTSPEIIALNRAFCRDFPVCSRDDGQCVLGSFDDKLSLEARQAVGGATLVEAKHIAVAQNGAYGVVAFAKERGDVVSVVIDGLGVVSL